MSDSGNGSMKRKRGNAKRSPLFMRGASDRNRTRNPLITNQLLYR